MRKFKVGDRVRRVSGTIDDTGTVKHLVEIRGEYWYGVKYDHAPKPVIQPEAALRLYDEKEENNWDDVNN
jgi:hypothetical protein